MYMMLSDASRLQSLVWSINFIIFGHWAAAWSPIIVKNVTAIGPQLTPDVTNVSRDGGYSALINGNIVYLYDDTECMDSKGTQLSFVSNTAAYGGDSDTDLRTVLDFGVVNLGVDETGSPKVRSQVHCILANMTLLAPWTSL